MQWLWSYITGQRSSRLIPEPRAELVIKPTMQATESS
jgi:hypothetical protein